MQTQTELPGTESKRRGRKDRDGTEETIDFQIIKDRAPEIMKLFRKSEAAKTLLNEGFKALAEVSGTNTGNLKKLFRSSLKGNFADARRDVDQQQVLFETIGEIQGGAPSAD